MLLIAMYRSTPLVYRIAINTTHLAEGVVDSRPLPFTQASCLGSPVRNTARASTPPHFPHLDDLPLEDPALMSASLPRMDPFAIRCRRSSSSPGQAEGRATEDGDGRPDASAFLEETNGLRGGRTEHTRATEEEARSSDAGSCWGQSALPEALSGSESHGSSFAATPRSLGCDPDPDLDPASVRSGEAFRVSLRTLYSAPNSRSQSQHDVPWTTDLDLDRDPELDRLQAPDTAAAVNARSLDDHVDLPSDLYLGSPDLDLDLDPREQDRPLPFHARHPLGPTSSAAVMQDPSDCPDPSDSSSDPDPEISPSDPVHDPSSLDPSSRPDLLLTAAASARLTPTPGLNLFAPDPWGSSLVGTPRSRGCDPHLDLDPDPAPDPWGGSRDLVGSEIEAEPVFAVHAVPSPWATGRTGDEPRDQTRPARGDQGEPAEENAPHPVGGDEEDPAEENAPHPVEADSEEEEPDDQESESGEDETEVEDEIDDVASSESESSPCGALIGRSRTGNAFALLMADEDDDGDGGCGEDEDDASNSNGKCTSSCGGSGSVCTGSDDDVRSSAVTRSCLLYTSPSPRDRTRSRMPSSA